MSKPSQFKAAFGDLTNVDFLVITAIQAFGLMWVWNNAICIPFDVKTLLFGQVFVIILGLKMFIRDLLMPRQIAQLLTEIRDVSFFAEQNNRFQFSAVVALLNETIKEREAEKLLEKHNTPDK